jgi:hypothetical protein
MLAISRFFALLCQDKRLVDAVSCGEANEVVTGSRMTWRAASSSAPLKSSRHTHSSDNHTVPAPSVGIPNNVKRELVPLACDGIKCVGRTRYWCCPDSALHPGAGAVLGERGQIAPRRFHHGVPGEEGSPSLRQRPVNLFFGAVVGGTVIHQNLTLKSSRQTRKP